MVKHEHEFCSIVVNTQFPLKDFSVHSSWVVFSYLSSSSSLLKKTPFHFNFTMATKLFFL